LAATRYFVQLSLAGGVLSDDRLAYYQTGFTELRERLIRVLGAPTVNRLIDRSVAEISRAHPGIASLRCEDDELRFEGVGQAFAEASDDEIRNTFAALTGVLLLLIARLLGSELADRLTEGLSVAQQSALRRV
jgi:hypothetical protein